MIIQFLLVRVAEDIVTGEKELDPKSYLIQKNSVRFLDLLEFFFVLMKETKR